MTGGNDLAVDASAVVAMLTDRHDRAEWVANAVLGKRLFAPELLYYEAANILRREQRKGTIDETTASIGYRELMELPIHLEPFAVLADRVWDLRGSVTSYDAAYVAVAEWRHAPLLTADLKLTRSNGPRCEFMVPPDGTGSMLLGPGVEIRDRW